MGKIKIPAATELKYQELPYYWVQVTPDRIQYTIPNHSHQELKKKLVSGVTSTNATIQRYLDILLADESDQSNRNSRGVVVKLAVLLESSGTIHESDQRSDHDDTSAGFSTASVRRQELPEFCRKSRPRRRFGIQRRKSCFRA